MFARMRLDGSEPRFVPSRDPSIKVTAPFASQTGRSGASQGRCRPRLFHYGQTLEPGRIRLLDETLRQLMVSQANYLDLPCLTGLTLTERLQCKSYRCALRALAKLTRRVHSSKPSYVRTQPMPQQHIPHILVYNRDGL
jgi:hypothetical protein